jgi:zinc/manganese transport system substrate-binding protein
MQRTSLIIITAAVIVIIGAGAASGVYLLNRSSLTTLASSTSTVFAGTKIKVVAAENFWGSLITQLGGNRVSVISIVTDPNTDPHEFESNTQDAAAIANASLVIVNGADYDTWALQLIGASSTTGQRVLNVQNVLNGTVNPGCAEENYFAPNACVNPHFWYSPYYVNYTVHAMYNELISSYMARVQEIKSQHANASVASTESIFAYMANATGLNLISPPGFMKAVAEGNDPSPQDIATFQDQISGGNSTVRVLVYNEQTVTPLTQQIKSLAAQHQIPTIGVTETIQPADVTFQFWMGSELIWLQNALNAQALGQ